MKKLTFKSPFFYPNPATFETPFSQKFSLPSCIIFYISSNPISAEGLLKLQKTCKYFFSQNKIVIISNQRVYQEANDLFIYDFSKENKYYFKNFSTKKIKFWPTWSLSCRDQEYPLNDLISKHIFRCSLYSLNLAHQKLNLNEIYFLINGEKLAWLELTYLTINDDEIEGTTFIDKILSKLPNLSYLFYDCKNELFTNQTFEKMNLVKLKSDYKNFKIYICNLDLKADVKLLCKFIQNISIFVEEACDFEIGFCIVENDEYVPILQAAINNMLDIWEDGRKHEITIL